jgi:hypothetical protein
VIYRSLVLILSVATSTTYASGPSLKSLTPPIGNRGGKFVVKATGANLDKVKEVVSYRADLICETIEVESEESLKLHFVANDRCQLGSYPIRLRSPSGLSELRMVTITPFPIVDEKLLIDGRAKQNQTILMGRKRE